MDTLPPDVQTRIINKFGDPLSCIAALTSSTRAYKEMMATVMTYYKDLRGLNGLKMFIDSLECAYTKFRHETLAIYKKHPHIRNESTARWYTTLIFEIRIADTYFLVINLDGNHPDKILPSALQQKKFHLAYINQNPKYNKRTVNVPEVKQSDLDKYTMYIDICGSDNFEDFQEQINNTHYNINDYTYYDNSVLDMYLSQYYDITRNENSTIYTSDDYDKDQVVKIVNELKRVISSHDIPRLHIDISKMQISCLQVKTLGNRLLKYLNRLDKLNASTAADRACAKGFEQIKEMKTKFIQGVKGRFESTLTLIKQQQQQQRKQNGGSLSKIDILGRLRNITKVGRCQMITYKNKQITLTKARQLEKTFNK